MKPEWKQELKSVDFPDNPVPPFELMGYQLDWEQDQRTLKKVAIWTSSVIIIIIGVVFFLFIKDAKNIHKEMITKQSSEINPFVGKISLRVSSTRTLDSLKSLFGKTKAKPGFRFVVIKTRIKNNSKSDFQISPYGVALFTDQGTRYNPHVGITKLSDGMKSQKLDPGEAVEGEFLYEIPSRARLKSLEIKSYTGPIATYHF